MSVRTPKGAAEVGGGGDPVVFLPGMMCDARLFAPQERALSGRVPVRHVTLTGTDTVEALADKVLDEVPGRFSLCGLSMGGIVAMAVAGRAPDRVARLALLDTNHLADAPERAPVRRRQIEAVRAGGLREVVIDEMKPQYLGERSARDRALLDRLVAMAEALGPEVFIDQSRAVMSRSDQSPALRRWARTGRATLVLCGAEDRLCPPARHHRIAALARAPEAVVLPGVGHIATLEDPDAVNGALAGWLGIAVDDGA